MINLIKEYLKLNEKQLFSKVRRELENYYEKFGAIFMENLNNGEKLYYIPLND